MASESAQGTTAEVKKTMASESDQGTTAEVKKTMASESATAEVKKTMASESAQAEAEVKKTMASESAQAEAEAKKVVLRTSNGQDFEIEEKIAEMLGTIKGIVEDGCADSAIPLPEVTSGVLMKVITYCEQHGNATTDAEELKAFDMEFVKMERDDMFEVLMAANYLDCRPLLDLISQAVADTIKDMTVEEVRDYFGIENDFTPEEEAKIRAENAWAFDH